MGLRHKSIRFRVLLLVLVPVLSLIGVYAYAATITVNAAVNLARAKTVKNVTALPTGALQQQLDHERGLALLYLAGPTSRAMAQLSAQEALTNRAVRAFEGTDMSGSLTSNASRSEKVAAAGLIKATGDLDRLRARVAAHTISRASVLSQYSAIVTAGYRVLEQAIQQYGNVPLVMSSLALIKLDEVDQLVLQESDLVASDLVARSFSAADKAEFTQLVGVRRYLVADTLPQLSSTDRALYKKYVSVQSTNTLTQLENTIIRAPAARGLPPVQPLAWGSTVTAFSTGLGVALTKSANTVAGRAQDQANATYLRLVLAGGLGLLAIIVSLLFSVLVGRGLVRQLAELRQSALELANERLPSVMQRLRDGQTVDVAAEAPPVESSADEIDQVRQAFNIVQRTAIGAAVDEANLRRGVSDVFRNLARRSQVLLHRQLRLLDGMERRASEPEELEDLFRIDHLTTRMRRHAEGLIILSGDSPGRSWRHPVPLVDVLRAAVAEVEDYTRIRVEARTSAALVGAAVADVIHLIAELAENATVFSPPNTPVRIHGDMVGRGFAVEVEDRGLGITEERLTEINRNLSTPPVFDLSGSDRLGLYIAGRLARRHGIKITLRPSPYGGTTAIMIIPLNLVVDENAYERVPSIGADGRGLPLGGRHAALSDSRGMGGGSQRDPGGQQPADSAWASAARLPVTTLPAPHLTAMDSPATAARPSDATTGLSDVTGLSGTSSRPPTILSGPSSAGQSPSGQSPSGQSRSSQSPSGQPLSGQSPSSQSPSGASPSGSLFERQPIQARATTSADSPPWSTGSQIADSPIAGTPVTGTPVTGSPIAGSEIWNRPIPGGQALGSSLDSRVPASSTPDPSDLGLPTRVRQASLAPQLRDGTRQDEGQADAASPADASPEAARDTMAALQRGWELGRSGGTGRPASADGAATAGDENAPDGAGQ